MMQEREERERREGQLYYRRELSLFETLPAIGAGVAFGIAGAYLVRLLLQRAPLVRERDVALVEADGTIVRRPVHRPGVDGR